MNTLFIFGAKYLVFLPVLIVIYYLWKSPEVRGRVLKSGVLSLPLSYILAKIAGHFFYNPRPFVSGGIAPLIQHVADNGFPSDHVLLVSAIASLVTVFNKKLAVWLWVITILVAWSRVYVGVHHVVDVVGSIIISLLATVVIYFIRKNKNNHA